MLIFKIFEFFSEFGTRPTFAVRSFQTSTGAPRWNFPSSVTYGRPTYLLVGSHRLQFWLHFRLHGSKSLLVCRSVLTRTPYCSVLLNQGAHSMTIVLYLLSIDHFASNLEVDKRNSLAVSSLNWMKTRCRALRLTQLKSALVFPLHRSDGNY